MLAKRRAWKKAIPHVGDFLCGRDDVATSVMCPCGSLLEERSNSTHLPQSPHHLGRHAGPIQRPIECPGGPPKVVDDEETSWRDDRFHGLGRLLYRKMVKEVDADHAVKLAQADRQIEEIRLHEDHVPVGGGSLASDPQHLRGEVHCCDFPDALRNGSGQAPSPTPKIQKPPTVRRNQGHQHAVIGMPHVVSRHTGQRDAIEILSDLGRALDHLCLRSQRQRSPAAAQRKYLRQSGAVLRELFQIGFYAADNLASLRYSECAHEAPSNRSNLY
jgi:hypothetical protein